jgi:hypothetical protein
VLRSGTEAWNQHSAGVACACIVKRGIASKLGTNPDYHDDEDHSAIPLGGNHTYLMYYCGTDGSEKGGWNMGVATAPHPLGPFTPYSGNPLVPKTWPDVNRSEGLYPSEVLNVDGGYIMYGEAILTPSHGAGGDGPGSPGQTGSVPLGGIGVWRSPRPEGPFTWAGYADMPGYWGNWDDGGSSSGAVTVHGGVFEMWCVCLTQRVNPCLSVSLSVSLCLSLSKEACQPKLNAAGTTGQGCGHRVQKTCTPQVISGAGKASVWHIRRTA